MEDLNRQDAESRREALFVPLFTSSERRLRSFVFGMVPSQQDVDEIMQEVSLVLWKKFDKYEPGTEFIRWAYVVARYEVLLYRRKKARDRLCFSEKLYEILGEEYEEDEDLLERERMALGSCMKKLPEADRQMLITVYSKDMKINEIAEASGRTATSLYKRLNRMREKLLTCVERQIRTA